MKNKLAQSQGLTAVTQQLNEYQSETEHRMSAWMSGSWLWLRRREQSSNVRRSGSKSGQCETNPRDSTLPWASLTLSSFITLHPEHCKCETTSGTMTGQRILRTSVRLNERSWYCIFTTIEDISNNLRSYWLLILYTLAVLWALACWERHRAG